MTSVANAGGQRLFPSTEQSNVAVKTESGSVGLDVNDAWCPPVAEAAVKQDGVLPLSSEAHDHQTDAVCNDIRQSTPSVALTSTFSFLASISSSSSYSASEQSSLRYPPYTSDVTSSYSNDDENGVASSSLLSSSSSSSPSYSSSSPSSAFVKKAVSPFFFNQELYTKLKLQEMTTDDVIAGHKSSLIVAMQHLFNCVHNRRPKRTPYPYVKRPRHRHLDPLEEQQRREFVCSHPG